jgi:dTDP-4-dehydrorhamnose 3,5-epimerase
MKVSATGISGVCVIERPRFGDDRGYLARLFCAEALKTVGWTKPVSQINQTYTAAEGTVRGMHFQHPPHAEMKLVNCLQGEVWDVAVDLRCGSPTFLHWHAERLSAGNNRALLIPEGCAHGFQSLTDDCVLVYCHSAPYAPDAEGGLPYDDPSLGIGWPLPVKNVSIRDKSHEPIPPAFAGIAIA